MKWNNHDHRGEYAEARHDHYGDYAELSHRHYDLERDDKAAQQNIAGTRSDIRELRGELDNALNRIRALEDANTRLIAALRTSAVDHDTIRTTGMANEAHLAVSGELVKAFEAFSDALSGAPDDEPEPDPTEYDASYDPAIYEHDPGPEVDDEGGMSEYRYWHEPEQQR